MKLLAILAGSITGTMIGVALNYFVIFPLLNRIFPQETK